MNRILFFQAINGALIETLSILILSISTISIFKTVREPLLGIWSYPVVGFLGFLFIFFSRYLPNAKAHEELMEALGEEYQVLLKKKLEKFSMISLMRGNWFTKRLKEYEDSRPTFLETLEKNIKDTEKK